MDLRDEEVRGQRREALELVARLPAVDVDEPLARVGQPLCHGSVMLMPRPPAIAGGSSSVVVVVDCFDSIRYDPMSVVHSRTGRSKSSDQTSRYLALSTAPGPSPSAFASTEGRSEGRRLASAMSTTAVTAATAP